MRSSDHDANDNSNNGTDLLGVNRRTLEEFWQNQLNRLGRGNKRMFWYRARFLVIL